MKDMLLASFLLNVDISKLNENDLTSVNTFLNDNFLDFKLKDILDMIEQRRKTFNDNLTKECMLIYALNSNLKNDDVAKYLDMLEELHEMEGKILDNYEKQKVDIDSDISRDFSRCKLVVDNINELIKRKDTE